MKTLIIPDIHGKVDLLEEILKEHGPSSNRIIQLGDLANCVASSRDGDIECLKIFAELQNERGSSPRSVEVLIGNHEAPYFGDSQPKFSGFWNLPEVREAIRKIEWKVATTVGNTLVTHAGLHPVWETQTAEELNHLWRFDPSNGIFRNIPISRGGRTEYGGIFWHDYNDPTAQNFPQIFGHTKGPSIRTNGNATCIDCEQAFIIETED